MKISLITVCKNSESTITRTLESVASQNYKNIEYIVIDGGSEDSTLSILNSFNKIIDVFISEKDDGVYNAINKGLKIATGDVVGIIHSDDYFCNKNVISAIAKKFSQTGAEILYSDINVVGRNKAIYQKWRPKMFVKNSFAKGWHPPHPGVYIKRSIYEEIGDYDESLEFSSDYDFLLRLFEFNNFKSVYFPKYTVNYSLGGGSSKNLVNILIGNFNIYKSFKKNNYKVNLLYFYFRKLTPKLTRMFKK